MTMTDPVADLLTRLRNANSAHHDTVALPSSKLKTNIAEILKQEGYISSWEVSDAREGRRRKRKSPQLVRGSRALRACRFRCRMPRFTQCRPAIATEHHEERGPSRSW